MGSRVPLIFASGYGFEYDVPGLGNHDGLMKLFEDQGFEPTFHQPAWTNKGLSTDDMVDAMLDDTMRAAPNTGQRVVAAGFSTGGDFAARVVRRIERAIDYPTDGAAGNRHLVRDVRFLGLSVAPFFRMTIGKALERIPSGETDLVHMTHLVGDMRTLPVPYLRSPAQIYKGCLESPQVDDFWDYVRRRWPDVTAIDMARVKHNVIGNSDYHYYLARHVGMLATCERLATIPLPRRRRDAIIMAEGDLGAGLQFSA